MSEHAKLSASASHRWMRCPGSVALCEKIPTERPSEYANEGKLAHNEAQICFATGRMAKIHDINMYIDYVRQEAKGTRFMIEEKVFFHQWVPGGYGTADAIFVKNDQLTIVDLKYGKGLRVDARDNSQLLLYALGAFDALELLYRINNIRMVIVQPRLEHISEQTLTIEELLKFGEVVKLAAERALDPKAAIIPGEIQCQFCLAKAVCKARAEFCLRLAQENFVFLPSTLCPPQMLGIEEIAALLPHLDGLIGWAKDVKEYALITALKGEKILRHKLVSGRAIRKWTAGAEDALKDLIPADQLYSKKSLVGIGEIEKIIGKNHEIFAQVTVKPSGKPALVQESDPRPEYNEAAADFTVIT